MICIFNRHPTVILMQVVCGSFLEKLQLRLPVGVSWCEPIEFHLRHMGRASTQVKA